MFRLSSYMRAIDQPTELSPVHKPAGPVVIWNLIRRCNLTCRHCYSVSADIGFSGELATDQVFTVMDDLRAFGAPALILSGGEPLLRPDIFTLAQRAKDLGFYVGLSTNGTLVDESNITSIARIGFDYVGISLDGLRATHDRFRQKAGAFDASLRAIRLCRDAGIRVGMRFTPTRESSHELAHLLDLMETEQVDKFYLSHLNYSGRGNRNRCSDVAHQTARQLMDLLFDRCLADLRAGHAREYVTGNNDADAVYLLLWVARRWPERYEAMRSRLQQWGGNASGVNIANIDNLGNVHPDTFWWSYKLGNVKHRRFSDIWTDLSDPLMKALKSRPRPLRGRCRVCTYNAICNGNTRIRAFQLTGDPWWEDPACYLEDHELGISAEEYQDDKPQPLPLDIGANRYVG